MVTKTNKPGGGRPFKYSLQETVDILNKNGFHPIQAYLDIYLNKGEEDWPQKLRMDALKEITKYALLTRDKEGELFLQKSQIELVEDAMALANEHRKEVAQKEQQ